jgi:hypothetical protein
MEIIKKISEKNKKVLVYNISTDAGFYSEIANMFVAISFCLENNIAFKMQSHGKMNFYDKGWCDYFKPFCDEIKSPLLSFFNMRPYMRHGIKKIGAFPYLLKKYYSIDYLTQDIFDQMRSEYRFKKKITIRDLNIDGSLLDFFSELIKEIYVFNDSVQKEIDKILTNLSLPEDYFAVHVRTAKQTEGVPLYEDELYMKHVIGNCKNVYIHSDSYDIIALIKSKYPYLNIFSLTPTDFKGWSHEFWSTDFIKLSPNIRKGIFINLLANVEIFRRANCFIGSNDNNPGMFTMMCRAGKNCIDIMGREFYVN